MAIGGADAQPPPLNLMSFHHLLKPFFAFQGTPNDPYDLSSHQVFTHSLATRASGACLFFFSISFDAYECKVACVLQI